MATDWASMACSSRRAARRAISLRTPHTSSQINKPRPSATAAQTSATCNTLAPRKRNAANAASPMTPSTRASKKKCHKRLIGRAMGKPMRKTFGRATN